MCRRRLRLRRARVDPTDRQEMSHTPADRIVIVSAETFAETAADHLAQAIRTRASGGLVSLALAGGSTPQRVYVALAAHSGVPWESVRIFFGDERAVAPDQPGSNYRMAHESLLSRVPIPGPQIFRMQADMEDREAAAVAYAATLPDRLDVLLLGVGSDGHTASLFPRSAAVRETTRTVVPALGPDPPRERLTITRPVIDGARHTIVLVTGAEKAAAVRAALQGPDDPEACPAQLARRGFWILDAAAASGLRPLRAD